MSSIIATRHTQPLAVSIQEAGQLLSISPHTIRGHIKRGVIQHVKIGRRLLIPMREIRALTQPTAAPTVQNDSPQVHGMIA